MRLIYLRMIFVNLFVFLSFTLTAKVEIVDSIADPFKLYNISFAKMIEENDIYQEWNLYSVGGFHEKKIGLSKEKRFQLICSGSERFPFSVDGIRLHKNLPLPVNSKKIEIYFNANFKMFPNPMPVYLTLEQRRIKEIVKKDSILIVDSDNFDLYQLSSAISDKATNFTIRIESAQISMYALNCCVIKIDTLPIESYTYDDFIKMENNLDFFKSVSPKLKIHKNINILSIGESLHGTNELEKNRYEIIKEKIKKGQCKLLLQEMQPLLGFKINQYVSGEIAEFPSILNKFDLCSNVLFYDLIEFIKLYNDTHKKKVVFAGFDTGYRLNQINTFKEIIKLFTLKNDLTEQFMSLIDPSDSVKITRDNVLKMRAVVREINIKDENDYWLTYLLRDVLDRSDYAETAKRDSVMAENASDLINEFGKNTCSILSGHLSHLSRSKIYTTSFQRDPSMGYYLSEKYGKNYFVLGQFAGGGKFWATSYKGLDNSTENWNNYSIGLPIGKSLEQYCQKVPSTRFYMNNVRDLDGCDIEYIRSVGRHWSPMQFYPFDFKTEIDAFVFIREVTPTKIVVK